MKLETFFEKFEVFADAPDAVERMRGLVLELAVKGAVSERQAADQDDPAWREFCANCDLRSRGSDSVRQQPFEIPAAWRWVCLGDLGTTRVRNDVEDGRRVSFVPMALISSAYGVSAQSEERTWSEVKNGFTHFAEGDVVMAKITPCFENAKSSVMRKLVNGLGAGTTELHVFRRATELILPEFVLIYIKTRGFIMRGEPHMTGSAGQKRVPREYFAASPFPLPPLAEQKRIVAKVDELMALCDRLELQQEEREKRHAAISRAALARFSEAPTPSNLNLIFHKSYTISPADLRKTILTLAVRGKLVPQDPRDEAADKLVARLEQERPRLAKEQGVRLPKGVPPLSVGEYPHDIPASWRWSRTGHLALVIDYGTSQKAGSDASKVPVYRMGNNVGGRLVNDNLKYVDPHIDDLPGL